MPTVRRLSEEALRLRLSPVSDPFMTGFIVGALYASATIFGMVVFYRMLGEGS